MVPFSGDLGRNHPPGTTYHLFSNFNPAVLNQSPSASGFLEPTRTVVLVPALGLRVSVTGTVCPPLTVTGCEVAGSYPSARAVNTYCPSINSCPWEKSVVRPFVTWRTVTVDLTSFGRRFRSIEPYIGCTCKSCRVNTTGTPATRVVVLLFDLNLECENPIS